MWKSWEGHIQSVAALIAFVCRRIMGANDQSAVTLCQPLEFVRAKWAIGFVVR